MPAERPNFYLLLELDPSVDDRAVIELRIVEKQRAWSHDRSMGNPKARRRAESSLALLPEIRAVLADQEARHQEAKAAIREQQKEKQERARELAETIAVLKSGGSACSESQVQKLVQQLAGAFTAGEVKDRLRAAGVPLAGEAGPAPSPRRAKERIDKVTAASIRQNLDHLQLANLYEFLELNPRSSPRALSDRAEEVYRDNQRLGKTDAQASARNALAGSCKALFQSDREKQKYDNYLAIEVMETLKPRLELVGADNFVSREEMDALVLQARQRGVTAEDARAFIEDYAALRKWGVQRDSGALPSEALRLCGFCSALASGLASKCPTCGEPFELDCPRCGVRNSTANIACQSCGSRIGDAPLVKALLKESERLALEGDFAGALRSCDKALLYWPDWKPAVEARQRVDGRRREREGALAAIDELVLGRKLLAARSALDRCQRTHGAAGLEDLRRRVQEGLARAEAAYQEGEKRRRDGQSEAALDRYEDALAACADYEPALRVMATSPPPPPTQLQVVPAGVAFRLAWQSPPTSRALAFQVVRKAGGTPQSVEDGERLAQVRGGSLDDTSAAVGTPWFYAVFSLRGGVCCHRPATSGPHLRTAEVADLEVIAGNGEVTLRWTPPSGCRRVDVWRRQGAPPDGAHGTALIVAGATAHDTGLTNGLCYGYRVVAVFADPSRPGGELKTAGCAAAATPVAPPAPILDLTASRNGRIVLLRWSPVAGATAQIRQGLRPPDAKPGLVLAAAQADRFGTLVPATSGNGAQVTLAGQCRVFFVPLSIAAGTAVVGAVAEVTALDPVQRLTVRRNGPHLAMTWEWPEGTDEVLVAWSYDRHVEDPRNSEGNRMLVTRREYDRSGCWLLQSVERRPHYISVFAKTSQGELFAQPARVLETLGQGASVAYRVGVKRSLLRRSVEAAWLELTSPGGDGLTLPPLVVIGKSHAVPLSPRDGELILEIPGLRLERGRALLPLPAGCWRGSPYVRLFFKNAEAAREIRLLPAEKDRLQLV